MLKGVVWNFCEGCDGCEEWNSCVNSFRSIVAWHTWFYMCCHHWEQKQHLLRLCTMHAITESAGRRGHDWVVWETTVHCCVPMFTLARRRCWSDREFKSWPMRKWSPKCEIPRQSCSPSDSSYHSHSSYSLQLSRLSKPERPRHIWSADFISVASFTDTFRAYRHSTSNWIVVGETKFQPLLFWSPDHRAGYAFPKHEKCVTYVCLTRIRHIWLRPCLEGVISMIDLLSINKR
jgi:hypothetical protein